MVAPWAKAHDSLLIQFQEVTGDRIPPPATNNKRTGGERVLQRGIFNVSLGSTDLHNFKGLSCS